MKVKFLLFLTVYSMLIWTESKSQNYIPLPDSNATWNLDFMSINCPPFGYCYTTSFSIIMDTIVANHTYHLTNSPLGGSGSGFIPAYRQDTANKKVYFPWQTFSGSGIYIDTLLFDYSMQIGDSIQDLIAYGGIYYKVLAIDSVFNGTQYLKRFYIGDNSNPTTVVIEGVGNGLGLFGFFFAFEHWFQVNCLSKDNVCIYPDNNTTCNPVSILELNKYNYVTLFPSIAKCDSKINIILSGISTNIKLLSIIDLLGKIQIKYDYPSMPFSVQRLRPGCYVVLIELENNNKLSRKLIIN